MSVSLCIGLIAGSLLTVLPTQSLTLAWLHTVEQTRWEEDYVLFGSNLVIKEARVERSGAGMEPGENAVWSHGWWRYRPNLVDLTEINLANSMFARGYNICWNGQCRELRSWAPAGHAVTMRAVPCSDFPMKAVESDGME
jgi:hypothetical protein